MIIKKSCQLTLNKTLVKPSTVSPQPQNFAASNLLQEADFLQAVFENLEDGILIISQTGKCLHANTSAAQICEQLNQGKLNSYVIPEAIWHLCKLLINSQQLMVVSDEIVLNEFTTFRIRVRFLDSHHFQFPCFLVIIENRYESLKNAAIAEVKKYDLTPREAEIWFLYRGNYSYKEIADKLYITINTVKKHMKNIHAKRQAFLPN